MEPFSPGALCDNAEIVRSTIGPGMVMSAKASMLILSTILACKPVHSVYEGQCFDSTALLAG